MLERGEIKRVQDPLGWIRSGLLDGYSCSVYPFARTGSGCLVSSSCL